MKKCAFCGESFEPASNRQKYCKRQHYRVCPICGERYIEDNVENLKRPPVACSYKCRVAKTQATSLQKYGIKTPGNTKDAREKSKRTMQQKYGVDYAMQSKMVQDKSKKILLERYGVDNASKCDSIKHKRAETCKRVYGDVLPFNLPESYEKQHNTIMAKYGVKYATLIHNDITFTHISNINKSFGDKLSNHGIEYEFEHVIDTKSYDIRLKDSDILIEINPSYTHSIVPNHYGHRKYPSYHQNKCKLAINNGFRCINIFDWDDANKIISKLQTNDILLSDDLEVKYIDDESAKKFVLENGISKPHIGRTNLGLIKDDTIYQIIGLNTPKHNKKYEIEITYGCTRLGYRIEGGFDKLSTFVSIVYAPQSVVCYIDCGKYIEKFPEEMGMRLSRYTQPIKWWSKKKEHIASTNAKEELMLSDGWLPVYDCGKMVFEWRA